MRAKSCGCTGERHRAPPTDGCAVIFLRDLPPSRRQLSRPFQASFDGEFEAQIGEVGAGGGDVQKMSGDSWRSSQRACVVLSEPDAGNGRCV